MSEQHWIFVPVDRETIATLRQVIGGGRKRPVHVKRFKRCDKHGAETRQLYRDVMLCAYCGRRIE